MRMTDGELRHVQEELERITYFLPSGSS